MNAAWRRAVAAVAVPAAVLGLLGSPASADDPEARQEEVQQQLADVHDDLHESSAAVQAAAAALARSRVEIPRAQARLAAAEGRVSAARAVAEASRERLEFAKAELARAEADVAAALGVLDKRQEQAGKLSRAIYMIGPAGFATAVFDSGSISDLAARSTYVYALLSDAAGNVREASAARVEVANKASILTARRTALAERDREVRESLRRIESYAAEARAAKAAVDAQVAARAAAMAVAERERAADLARYRALQEESRRLAELIRRNAISRGNGRAGALLWPTEGPVTSGYGYRTHPIYGYKRFHAGIDIGAPTGQRIVAVATGTVVSAGAMGTYGNLVVIDHGNGLATAYAHQSRIAVRSGQRVARGTVIGYVGSTGASTGPHLHFETRVNGDPVDPMRYY